MALQDLLDAIATEADHESAKLIRESESEAERILRDAASQAATIRESTLESRAHATRAEVDRRIAVARQEASRLRRDVDEQAFGALLSEAREQLSQLYQSPRYPQVLVALLREALAAVGDADTVRANPRDVGILRSEDDFARLTVIGDADVDEGVVVTSAAGRCVRNSLASRLATAEPDLRRWYHVRLGELAAATTDGA